MDEKPSDSTINNTVANWLLNLLPPMRLTFTKSNVSDACTRHSTEKKKSFHPLPYKIRKVVAGITFFFLFAISTQAQNNLDIVGLSSANTGSNGVAYGLRLLTNSYTGPLVRIHVGSNFYDVYPDATANKAFSLTSPISASVSTYNAAVSASTASQLSSIITAGVTNATVAIWYDQSGNSRNTDQSSSAGRPAIISSGSIITQLGRPTIQFNTSTSLNLSGSISYGSGALVGAKNVGLSTTTDGFICNNSTAGFRAWSYLSYGTPYDFFQGNQWVNGNQYLSSASDALSTLAASQILHVYSGRAPTTPISFSGNGFSNTLGYMSPGFTALTGYISECIIFASIISTDNRTTVEYNQQYYFNAGPLKAAATTVCSNTALSYDIQGTLTATAGVGATYSWSRPTVTGISNAANSGATSNITETLVNTTNAAITVPYTITTVVPSQGSYSQTLSVTVQAAIASNTISNTTSALCTPGTPAAFTASTPTGGTGSYTYLWESSTNGTNFSAAGGTSNTATYTPGSLSQTTWYRRTVSSGVCAANTSSSFMIGVASQPFTVGTHPTSSQTICYNTTGTLTALGAGGTSNYSYQWYSNTSALNTGGTIIGGAISSTYTVPATTTAGNRFYYAVITDVSCAATVTTNAATVTTGSAATVGTQPASTQTLCNNIAGTLTALGSGGSSSFTYQWYSNTSALNTGGTIVGGAISSTYTVPATSTVGNRYYYAVITDASCVTNTINSNAVTVTTLANLTTGTQPTASQNVCNTATATLTALGSGGSSNYSYQWYSNTSNLNSGGTIASGAISSTYTIPATNTPGTNYYYAVISDATCLVSINTNAATVISDANVTNNTFSTSTPHIHTGTTPATITGSTPVGGSGSMSYHWRMSTDGISFIPATGTINGINYSPGALTQTTWFRRQAISATCINFPGTNDNVKITVYPLLTIGTQPTAAQTICNNTTVNITALGSGGSLSYTYQWYSNTSNSNTGGTLIDGATSSTYTVPATGTSGNRYFYAVVTDLMTTVTITSSVAEVTTRAALTIPTQPQSSQTIINNTTTALSMSATGGTGSYTYQWYSNTTNSNSGGSSISSATSTNYTVPATTTGGTRYFYAVVTDAGCAGPVATNVAAVITTDILAISTQPATTQTVCNNTGTPATVAITGGSGTYVYQWYSNTSASNTGGTLLNGETSAIFTKQLSDAGTYYYYATMGDPVCGSTIPSNVATAQVNALPTVTVSSGTQTICQNTTASGVSATVLNGAGGISYQWFSNSTAASTGGTSLGSGNGAQTATYTPPSAAFGTTYYYVVASLSGNGCGAAASATHQTVVNYVAQPSDISVTPHNSTLCAGLPATLRAALSNSSSIVNPVFTWYSDANLTSQVFSGADVTTPVLNNTTVYYIKVNGNNVCGNIAGNGFVETINVTVSSQAPVLVQPANITECANVNISGVAFASSVSNTTYTWSNNNTATGLASSGSGNLPSFTGVNGTLSDVVANINVSPFANGCAGLTKSFTITIKPVFTIADATAAVCSGANISYSADNVPAGTKYSWTAVTVPAGITGATSNGVFQNVFSQTLVNTTNAPIQVVYAVSADGCSTRSFNLTITVNPVPAINNQTLPAAICSGAGFSFTPGSGIVPAGAQYIWDAPTYSPLGSVTGGALGSTKSATINGTILVNSLPTLSNATYIVTPYSPASMGSCAGPTFTFTVPVNPKPLLNVTSIPTICNNGTVVYVPASTTTGVTYSWRRELTTNISTPAATGTNGISEQLTNTAAFPVLVNYIYTLTANGCSNEQTVQVIVNPDPLLSSATTISTCSGSIFNYNPSSLTTNTSFAWTRPVVTGIRNAANAGNNDVFEALVNTTNAPVVVTYQFTLGFSGCVKTQDMLVTVNPIPTMLETADQAVCNGAALQVNFSGSALPNTTYSWTNNNSNIGLSSAGQGNIQFTAVNQQVLTQTGVISVVPVANGCSGTTKNFSIAVNPTPELSSSLTPASVCSNAAFTYLPKSNTPGTMFSWTRAAVTGIENAAASGTGTINEVLRNNSNGAIPVVYEYTLTANGCVSKRTITVIVAPIPVVSSPGSQVVCNNSLSIVNFSGSIVNNTTYNWTNDNASLGLAASGVGDIVFNAINAGTVPLTGDVKVTPEASGCKGIPVNFTITINPTLALSSSLTPAAICSNSNFSYVPTVADTSSLVSISWSRPAVYGLSNKPSFGSKEINDTLINSTGSPILVTYIFTLKNSYCSNTQNVVVQVNPAITITNIQSGISVCNGEPFVFSPVSGATGIQYQWSRAAVAGISNSASSGTGDINEVLINPSDVPIDVTYKYMLSIGTSCNSDQLLKVTVKPSPKLLSSTNMVSCSNALLSYVPKSSLSGTTFTWTRAAVNGISNSAANGFGSITENLLNTTSAQVGVRYAVDLANINGCNTTHTVSVGVNPLPTAGFVADQSVCAGTSTKLIRFTGGLTGTSFAWTNSEPGIGLSATGTGDIQPFVASNTTSGTLMATIQVTPVLNGCNGNAITVARINVNQPVVSNFIELYPAIACPGKTVGPLVSSVPLGGDGVNFAFQWQLSTDSVNFTNIQGAGAGNRNAVAPAQTKDSWYRMQVSSGGCTSVSAPVKILLGKKPTITITNRDNYVVSKGNATQLFAEGAVSYQWTPATFINNPIIANPFVNPVTDTRYTVTGTNAEGCSDTASVFIRVVDGYSIFPNNVLTPNGDGFNDTWKIKNIEYYPINTITIFNSNSVKVFEKQNYTGDWNGTTIGGAKLSSGVYYYVIKLKQGEVVVKGDLTILN